eukprot:2349633-Rhodomonas_salina.3
MACISSCSRHVFCLLLSFVSVDYVVKQGVFAQVTGTVLFLLGVKEASGSGSRLLIGTLIVIGGGAACSGKILDEKVAHESGGVLALLQIELTFSGLFFGIGTALVIISTLFLTSFGRKYIVMITNVYAKSVGVHYTIKADEGVEKTTCEPGNGCLAPLVKLGAWLQVRGFVVVDEWLLMAEVTSNVLT